MCTEPKDPETVQYEYVYCYTPNPNISYFS